MTTFNTAAKPSGCMYTGDGFSTRVYLYCGRPANFHGALRVRCEEMIHQVKNWWNNVFYEDHLFWVAIICLGVWLAFSALVFGLFGAAFNATFG